MKLVQDKLDRLRRIKDKLSDLEKFHRFLEERISNINHKTDITGQLTIWDKSGNSKASLSGEHLEEYHETLLDLVSNRIELLEKEKAELEEVFQVAEKLLR